MITVAPSWDLFSKFSTLNFLKDPVLSLNANLSPMTKSYISFSSIVSPLELEFLINRRSNHHPDYHHLLRRHNILLLG